MWITVWMRSSQNENILNLDIGWTASGGTVWFSSSCIFETFTCRVLCYVILFMFDYPHMRIICINIYLRVSQYCRDFFYIKNSANWKKNVRKHQVETQYNRYCALKFNKRILECDSAFLSGMVPLNTCLNAWRTLKDLNEVFLRYFTFLSPSKRNSIAPEITDLRTHHGE